MNWLISLRNEKTPALEKKFLLNGNYRQNLASVSVNFNIVFSCVKRISIVFFCRWFVNDAAYFNFGAATMKYYFLVKQKNLIVREG